MIRTLFAAAILFASTLYAQAEGKKGASTSVDVVLVLAVDVSGSVSAENYKLQMNGYAAAFSSEDVINTIVRNRLRIGVTMVHWSEAQVQVTDWHLLVNAVTAHSFARVLQTMERAIYGGSTALDKALVFSTELAGKAPFKGDRCVIDVSGDGPNNLTTEVSGRDYAVQAGCTVNGLPIVALDEKIVEYYAQNVIGGPGAFLIKATCGTFVQAVRMKIVWEISAIVPPRYAMLK